VEPNASPAVAGTQLLQYLIALCEPLSATIEKAIDACPKSHDFCLQAPGMYEFAREEHINRVHQLQLLRVEFEELAVQISGILEEWNSDTLSAF
jgi:hypothetical protein